MPKPRSKPTPIPPPKRPRRLWLNVGVAVLALAALIAVVVMSSMPSGTPQRTANITPTKAAPVHTTPDADLARYSKLSARDLVAMSDAELEAMDPLVMNMVVAKGVPDLAGIDFAKYAKMVDEWAVRLRAALEAGEAEASVSSPAYRHDPDLWRAGGMAMALAGQGVGIAYTREVKMTNHADLFVPGLIDTKRGTCSNMPVLYLAVARRMGWPLKAVVAADHMWTRWDDGRKQFNLEATNATSDGELAGFSTPTDEQYTQSLNIPPKAIEIGSDLATLTARQTLGVYLQQRAGYWRAIGKLDEAEADFHLARICFPQNRDIFKGLLIVMDERAKGLFTPEEMARMFRKLEDPAATQAKGKADQERLRQQMAEVDRINRENQERRRQGQEPPR